MDIKKINENLDDFNIDELELSEDNLCEIEIEAIRKEVKSKIKKPRKKGKIVAASTAIIITGTMFTPAIAKNLPFISDIYKELGFFDGYEEYTKYIGESKSDNGYKVTIDNISTNGANLLVGIRVESEKEEIKNKYINCFTELINKPKSGSVSATSSFSYIDNKTAIITHSINLSDINQISSNKGIKLVISMLDEVSNNNLMNVSFDLNADFKGALSKLKVINVRKKLNDNIYIYSLKGTVKGSNLKVKDTLIYNDSNPNYMIDHKYYLNVDGVIHKVDINNSSNFDDGIGSFNFPYLTAEEIKSAKSIELIVVEAKRLGTEEKLVEFEEGRKGSLIYPSKLKTKNGLEGEFYNVEIHNNKIRLHFKSSFEALGTLGNMTLWTGDEEKETLIQNIGIIKKDKNGYILEFNNVDLNKKSKLITYDSNLDLDNVKTETIKIK